MRNLYIDDDYDEELITEMAMVGLAWDKHRSSKYAVAVDSSETRIGEPYFKFYSGPSRRNKKAPVARISFLSPRYIIHYRKSNNNFVLDASQRRALVNFMNSPHEGVEVGGRELTNWEYAILQYNLENIEMDGWGAEQWAWFTSEWKEENMEDIIGEEAEQALVIDLPMPNYLKLRA